MKRTWWYAAVVAVALVGCRKQPEPTGAVNVPVIRRMTADESKLDAEAKRLATAAAAEHRHVVLFFHADWCGPCQLVGQAFERANNRAAFDAWYLVSVDVDKLPPGPVLGLPIDTIPHFVKLDDQGHPAGELDGEAFGADPDPARVDLVMTQFLRS